MNARATQSLISSAVDIKIDFAKFRESVAGLPPTNFHYRSQGRWQFEWDEGGEVEVANLDGVIGILGRCKQTDMAWCFISKIMAHESTR